MTTETTVSKGQEFFSPGQTRGGYRGNINWEHRGVIVVVDTTKMDNVRCLSKECPEPTLLQQRLDVKALKRRKNKTGSAGDKLLSCVIMRRTSSPATWQHPLFTDGEEGQAQGERDKIIPLQWLEWLVHVFHINTADFWFKRLINWTECQLTRLIYSNIQNFVFLKISFCLCLILFPVLWFYFLQFLSCEALCDLLLCEKCSAK